MWLYGLSLPSLTPAVLSLCCIGDTKGRTEPTFCSEKRFQDPFVWQSHQTNSCCWMACMELMQTSNTSPVRAEAVLA